MLNLDYLMKRAIELKGEMSIRLNFSEYLSTSSLKNKSFFCINDTYVLFYLDNSLFLIPYSKLFIQILVANSFELANIGDFDGLTGSLSLVDLFASKPELFDYHFLAQTFSNSKGITALPNKYIEKCLKIPKTGIELVSSFKKAFMYYPASPLITKDFWNKIGTFNMLNSTVVFIDANGDTYVSYNWSICQILSNCGYEKDSTLFVPLSQGEHISNKNLDLIWQSMKY